MDNLVIRVVHSLTEDVGTPRALAVKLLCDAGEWVQLQELKTRPSDYQDLGGLSGRLGSESYWRDTLVTDLLRKTDLPTSVDREAAAVSTFFDCEKQCATTNARLTRYLPETLFIEDPEDLAVHDFICRVRKEVSYVLGNLPDSLTPRFSKGATYADTGLYITIPDKMSSAPTIYSATRDLLPLWGETSWARSLMETRPWQSDPNTVRGNIFFTVPKDGTKFRGCCKEASIPVCYQLDAGRIMKERLKRIGIDLLEGQSHHRLLAKVGSEKDNLVTIDMSNASDTVCRVLVKLLLPGQWYELLNSLRATHTRVNDQWFRLEKFSSMGNGFTFELETLIFACMARAVVAMEGGDPDLVTCYGDDLIAPAAHSSSVLAALRLFGFTPNTKKTFVEGPFRESCGGDFWEGVPVRAHFIQELPDEPQQWISLANGLRRVATADGSPTSRWAIVRRSWFRALDPIPSHIRRCRGPQSLGDIVIHDVPENWGRAEPPKTQRKWKTKIENDWKTIVIDEGFHTSWEQEFVYGYIPMPKVLRWHHWLPAVQLASCTLGLPSDGVTPRDDIEGYKVGRVPLWFPASTTPKLSMRDSNTVRYCSYSAAP